MEKLLAKINEIVVTEGIDKGVVLLSQEGPTHYDPELKVQAYDHENFSPLGDALIELYEMIKSLPSDKPDWRIGLRVKGKYRASKCYERGGKVMDVFPSGTAGLIDSTGVLAVLMLTGETVLSGADAWVTA